MPNPSPTPFGYQDATGARHRVLVRQTPDGVWQVLDVTVIETLTGIGEGRATAEALARDYVAEHHHAAPAACRRRQRHRAAA